MVMRLVGSRGRAGISYRADFLEQCSRPACNRKDKLAAGSWAPTCVWGPRPHVCSLC